jgi:hypothetical protein
VGGVTPSKPQRELPASTDTTPDPQISRWIISLTVFQAVWDREFPPLLGKITRRRTARYRTVQIRAGQHVLTAEDPLPNELRDALAVMT